MHQPDGDNIIIDNAGDSFFQDGPPASTLDASMLNAISHELINILKAYGITPKNSGNDTYDQIAGALLARDQGKTREASVVIASSDSDENARLTADVVISTNEDAAVILNAQMVTLSANGGGKIFLRKGNYYCGATKTLDLCNNINIFGEGSATAIYAGIFGGSEIIFNANTFAAKNYTISNIKLVSSGVGNSVGRFIYGDTTDYSSTIHNIICIGGGIWGQNNVSDIYIYGTATKNVGGINYCGHVIACIIDHTLEPTMNTATIIDFHNCVSLVNCISVKSQRGYEDCWGLVNCGVIRASSVFSSAVSALYSAVGFYRCSQVTLCYAHSFVSVGTGFISVVGMMQNHTRGVSTGYLTCYADRGGFDAAADRSVGGWNVAY